MAGFEESKKICEYFRMRHMSKITWHDMICLLQEDPVWPQAQKYLIKDEKANGIDLPRLWCILDQGWFELQKTSKYSPYSEAFLGEYYNHPVWMINAAFSESDQDTISDRQAAIRLIEHVAPERILDFGGGIGSAARLCADRFSAAKNIDVLDISPFYETTRRHLSKFKNIRVLAKAQPPYDAVLCTEVLEHVSNPISLLVDLNKMLRIGGALSVSYSFAPGIACHIPKHFHLQPIMIWVIRCLGFGFYGFERRGSTVYGFVKNSEISSATLKKAKLLAKLACLPFPMSRLLFAIKGL